jgi:predicted alpha/beta superfamily hydrolase
MLAMALLSAQTRVSSLTGNIESIPKFESKILGNQRNLIVYLPAQYKSEPNRKFPVLYMHDGQNIFDGMTSYIPNQEWRADEAAESLINAGLIEPLIIVGIDNAGIDRGNEYLPFEIKMGNNRMGGRAEKYGQMLTQELMPMIQSRYRIKTGPENTGVCGSSFGGVISCFLGQTYPDVFGRVGIVSPSVWVADKGLLKLVTPVKRGVRKPRVWIDMGGAEGPGATSDAKALYETYLRNGWKPKSEVIFVQEENARHDELAWSRRIDSILVYLFGKK